MWRCPATNALPGHTLKAKTCNDTNDGTVGQLFLSFCEGGTFCKTGQENVYNSHEELKDVGTWNTLEIPLEYEPTTMSMTLEGSDAWCIEELMWDDGQDMLGNGGRIYFDGNLGETGCNYGVHTTTGWYYPCQSSWRFFNLPGSDDYEYEVRVKPCHEAVTNSDSTQTSSPTIACFLCAESQCDASVGEVVALNLTLATEAGTGKPAATSDNGWSSTVTPAGFNPVAMKLTNMGEYPWCAEEITFNGFTLVNPDVSPRGMKLGVGDNRMFFNLQALGVWEESDSEFPDITGGNGMEDKAWDVAAEVITGVIVFAASVAFTSFMRRCLKPATGRDQNQDNESDETNCDEEDEDDGSGDGDIVVEGVPLCKTCHCVDHRRTVELTRLPSEGKRKMEPLLGDDSCARSFTNTPGRGEQPRDDFGKLARFNSDEWGRHHDQKGVSGRISSKTSQEDSTDSPSNTPRRGSVTGDGPGLFFYERREPERAREERGRDGRNHGNNTMFPSSARASSTETVVEDYSTQQNTFLPV